MAAVHQTTTLILLVPIIRLYGPAALREYILHLLLFIVSFKSFNSTLSRCSLTVNSCSATVCQLRVHFFDLSLAPPDGDGFCNTDIISITGGSSNVPILCGENSGQHVVVNFDGTNPITITVTASSTYTFGRNFFISTTQFNCASANLGKLNHLF